MQETILPPHEAAAKTYEPRQIRLRVAGQYLTLYLLAFVLGILLCSLLDIKSLPAITPYVKSHFVDSFSGCAGIYDRLSVVVDAAQTDIRAMLLILTAGFTFFCPLALSLMNAWRGFSLGFTAAYLFAARAEGLLTFPQGAVVFLLFLGVSIPIAAALIYLSAEAVLFSHTYRTMPGRISKILRQPFLWRYLFGYLTMFGFVLIMQLLYCIFIALLL